MAMFARRSLQRLLDDLESKLSFEARQKLARELNRQDASALGYEWELALLFALSQVGQVTYEAHSHAGTSCPDITFAEGHDGPIRFVADVVTISDTGLEAENPVMRFSQSLHRLKRKYGLPGALSYDIKGEFAGRNDRDRKMHLKLPKAADLDRFLENHVGPKFRNIANEKRKTASIIVREPGIEFLVTYAEGQRYGSGHYPSYTAAYGGLRIKTTANVDGAKVRALVDIGFGDAVEPGLVEIDLPVLLDQPSPHLRAYPFETVIAEKFQAMVALGRANSRMKDFYDIWILARSHEFVDDRLARAIAATFARRNTKIPVESPDALTQAFAEDPSKQRQWAAFLQDVAVNPGTLSEVIHDLEVFLMRYAREAQK